MKNKTFAFNEVWKGRSSIKSDKIYEGPKLCYRIYEKCFEIRSCLLS